MKTFLPGAVSAFSNLGLLKPGTKLTRLVNTLSASLRELITDVTAHEMIVIRTWQVAWWWGRRVTRPPTGRVGGAWRPGWRRRGCPAYRALTPGHSPRSSGKP